MTDPEEGEDLQGTRNAAFLLQNRLDELLEDYLNLLDRHQTHRQALGSRMSAGFMSLAQANFNSQSRVRFGQDFYDDRMKAIRKIDITEEQEGEIVRFDVKTELPQPKASDPEQSTETEETIPSSTLPNTEETHKEKRNKETEKATQTQYRDPIHWFGILVPQALRSSQEAFIKVVEEDMSPILHLDAQLKQLEIEIRRTRKHIAKLSSKESRAQSGN